MAHSVLEKYTRRDLVMKTRPTGFLVSLTAVIVISLMLCVCSSEAAAPVAAPPDFIKDKVLKVMLSSSPGGSNDIVVRLATSYLTELTDAKISVVANTAGAGLVCNNEFYTKSKPDGLTVLYQSYGSVWNAWLMDGAGVKYDITKLTYLGGLKAGPYVLGVSLKSPHQTVAALKTAKGLKFAASEPTSILTLASIAATEALGLDAKIVTGYKTATKLLALQQGEAELTVSPWDSMKRAEKDGQLKNLFQIGLKRDPSCPLPCLAEVVSLTDSQKKLVEMLFSDGKFFAAPPGVPADRIAFLKDVISKTLNDKGFQQSAEASLGAFYGYESAEDITKDCQFLSARKTEFKRWTPLMQKYIK
jgi:tripartite-type tricarboxylate transporter receptor subunit TctC